MYFFRAFVKELRSSLAPKKSAQTYIEKEKVDNHLPTGPLLAPKKLDDDSDDDYHEDVEEGSSSGSSIRKTAPPPL